MKAVFAGGFLVVMALSGVAGDKVYELVPPGGKYELVLDGAEHMAFSDRTLLGRQQRNPNHHQVILALSTAFWDSYLRGDEAAREWLDGDGPDALVEEGDVWEKK